MSGASVFIDEESGMCDGDEEPLQVVILPAPVVRILPAPPPLQKAILRSINLAQPEVRITFVPPPLPPRAQRPARRDARSPDSADPPRRSLERPRR